eukprot:TRINITY_DN14050_c0_g1_i1.p1 TRINITY_DN14050_c0_g1~~TRINITY_DN14050_c0_g1_i1.p1  ORF type:complete len:339 (-),score=73.45 TRINITY_DN14050_c0_g1_i1:36-953(-)
MREIMSGEATPSQISAYLVGLHFNRSIEYTPQMLLASSQAMLGFALPINCGSDFVLDIVGTGGDMLDTFNASTAAAVVVAASGVTVAKHGNRSSSGRCGSADLMEALGANINTDNLKMSDIIKECHFGFLFAQKFHPSMKSVAQVRREIGVRTIFNILGPLSNPANPTHMLVGVGEESLGSLYAQVFLQKGCKRVMVVHSLDGLDEISTETPTKVWLVENGTIKQYEISPNDFGLPFHRVENILGADPITNASTFKLILNGAEGPVTDFLLMNAGAALFVAEKAKTLKEGAELARQLLKLSLIHI